MKSRYIAISLTVLVAVGCGRVPRQEVTRQWKGAHYEFSIGLYSGTNPLTLTPHPDVAPFPVFTGADIPYVPTTFVADPFVIHRDPFWYLFFEMYNAWEGKGDIGLATSHDGKHWKFVKTILNEPFHLSYPFVFEWNHTWYMLPEGSQSGVLTLYRATEFPLRWVPEAQLLKGAYVDTTLLQYNDHWWMFTTPFRSSDLLLFMADSPLGPWKPHPASPIVKNNGHISRGGGRIIVYNGTPLRFTQDDVPTYGNALRAFRITKLSTNEYAEEPATANPILTATGKSWRAGGMHQLDPVEVQPNRWLAVVDGVGSAEPDTPLNVPFANGLRLDGISVRPTRVRPGGQVLIRCFFSGVDAVPANTLSVFAHLGPWRSKTILQADSSIDPRQEYYDGVAQVPSNAPLGRYELRIGLYDPKTGRKTPLKDSLFNRDEYHLSGALRVVASDENGQTDHE